MPYSRDALEAMPRSELQNVCKLYGFKANESNRKIIDNILAKDADEFTFNTIIRNTRRSSKPSAPPPPMDPQRTPRRVTRETVPPTQERRVTRSEAESTQMRRPSTRSNATPANEVGISVRKAKASQTRLGVGRPTVAGGTGARASTKRRSTTSKSSRRATIRRSRTIKTDLPSPVEDGDEEELQHDKEPIGQPDESNLQLETLMPLTPAATPDQSGPSSDYSQSAIAQAPQPFPSLTDFAPFHKVQGDIAHLTSVYQTLQREIAQVQILQTEIRSLKTIASKVPALETELKTLRVQANASSQLQNTVEELRKEVAFLRERLAEVVSMTTSQTHASLPTQQVPNYSGLLESVYQPIGTPQQVLGKRAREETPVESHGTGFLDNLLAQEGVDLAAMHESLHFGSPRKRSKTDDSPDFDTSPIRPTTHAVPEPAMNLDFSSIFNFSDSRVSSSSTDPPRGNQAPLATLPFPIVAASGSQIPQVTMQAPRSQLVDRRTPSRGSPFKRPTSVAANNHFRFATGNSDMIALPEEEDLLSTQLHHIADRPTYQISSVGVNPAQLLAATINTERIAAASPQNRTLFGTELEGDTRFGEFGVDGVANEFWKTPGYL